MIIIPKDEVVDKSYFVNKKTKSTDKNMVKETKKNMTCDVEDTIIKDIKEYSGRFDIQKLFETVEKRWDGIYAIYQKNRNELTINKSDIAKREDYLNFVDSLIMARLMEEYKKIVYVMKNEK